MTAQERSLNVQRPTQPSVPSPVCPTSGSPIIKRVGNTHACRSMTPAYPTVATIVACTQIDDSATKEHSMLSIVLFTAGVRDMNFPWCLSTSSEQTFGTFSKHTKSLFRRTSGPQHHPMKTGSPGTTGLTRCAPLFAVGDLSPPQIYYFG